VRGGGCVEGDDAAEVVLSLTLIALLPCMSGCRNLEI